VAQSAHTDSVATILGMERVTETGRQIAAFVIDAGGRVQGYQTKNQIDRPRIGAPRSSSIPNTQRAIDKVSA
jgi:hypothetical protein